MRRRFISADRQYLQPDREDYNKKCAEPERGDCRENKRRIDDKAVEEISLVNSAVKADRQCENHLQEK